MALSRRRGLAEEVHFERRRGAPGWREGLPGRNAKVACSGDDGSGGEHGPRHDAAAGLDQDFEFGGEGQWLVGWLLLLIGVGEGGIGNPELCGRGGAAHLAERSAA